MLKISNLISLFLLTIFFGIFASTTNAITKFDTKYQVYYRVEESGNTKVTFVITQTNNLSVVYATEYGISLNETKISNLKITDESTVIQNPSVVKSQNQTVISFPFANKVVGKNKVKNFTIEYETPEIVSKQGATWQINIPRFESSESISEQTAILSLPEKFPQPAYVDPKPDIVNNNTYYFSSKSMANKPISAIFGKAQYYSAKIDYHLANEQSSTASKSITLPPNTTYQTVSYVNIDPKPESIKQDDDGNLLAYYDLKANQSIDIKVELNIKTDFQAKANLFTKKNSYLDSNQIWNFNDTTFTMPEIKNLTSPKSIYDYVTNKLKYDYQKINESGTVRQPASEVLKNPMSAICTDFTDLFVTLSRKAGIPARELEGIAITDNQDLKPISNKIDLLHAWPEYFDKEKNTWIQVDPTWGNTTRGLDYFTKLDFNHIVFAIHGISPLEPVPAGGFRKNNSQDKYIQINPTEEFIFPDSKPIPSLASKGLNQAKLTIFNPQGTYLYGQIEVAENGYLKQYNGNINVPPFSQVEVLLQTKTFSFVDTTSSESIITINGINYPVKSNQEQVSSPFLFAIGGILLGASTFIARSLLLRRQRQKSTLHW